MPKVRLEWEQSKDGPVAYIRFRWVLKDDQGNPILDDEGKPVTYRPNKSQGPITREEAESIRATIAETISRLERGKLVCPREIAMNKDRFFEWLKRGGEVNNGVVLSKETLGQVIQDYVDTLPADVKGDGTRYTEDIHFGHLKRVLKEKTVFASIDKRKLQKYVKTRRNGYDKYPAVKGVTIGKELQSFCVLWQHAVDNDIVVGDCPAIGIDLPKDEEKGEFQTLSDIERMIASDDIPEDEQERLWEACILEPADITELLDHVRSCKHAQKRPFIVPMIALPLLTGCRQGEMIRSQRQDYDFDKQIVRVRETKKRKSYSGSTRRVDMCDKLSAIMAEWFANAHKSAYAVCQSDGSQLTKNMAHHHFEQAVKGSRFAHLKGFHTFRHSIISIGAMTGTPKDILQEWVGHIDDDTTRRYTHLIPSNAKQAMKDLGDLFG